MSPTSSPHDLRSPRVRRALERARGLAELACVVAILAVGSLGAPVREAPQVDVGAALPQQVGSEPLRITVRRSGPARLAVDLAIPAPDARDDGPRHLRFPAGVTPAFVRELRLDGRPAAENPGDARALEAGAAAGAGPSWRLELPRRGSVHVSYELAAPWPGAETPAPTASVVLLVGPESVLVAGTAPFGRVDGATRTELRFDLEPLALAWPPPDARGIVSLDADQELLCAFGPWRRETHGSAALLLPAAQLRLDAQGDTFDEADANAARELLARPTVPLARALGSRPLLALLPAPPRSASPYLLYLGGERLALGPRLWLLPTAACRDLARRATRELEELRALAERDPALADAFAAAFAIDAEPAGARERALRKIWPSAPHRASATERATAALLLAFEEHGTALAEEVCAASAGAALDLGLAWRAALEARGAEQLARFDALCAGRALFTSEHLGGTWAVREAPPFPEPGLYRTDGASPRRIPAIAELRPEERHALRDLCARFALELAWPLADRATRWPALDADRVVIDERGEIALDLGALYDAEAGWAAELAAGEAVGRLVVGGRLERASGRVVQRVSWRRDALALDLELELSGLVPAPEDPHAAADAPIGRVRARREGATLTLRVRGLPPPEDESGRLELGRLLVAALQTAPAPRGKDQPIRFAPRTPRAGAPATRSRARDEASPPGWSGTPLGERVGFGFQRWDAASSGWRSSALERDEHDPLRHPEEAAVHERLLRRFLDGLVWPLPRVEGAIPYLGGDDLPFRSGHDEGHDALDLGSRLASAIEALPLHYPAGTAVRSPHRDARRLLHPAGYPVLVVELREGAHRLRVRLDLVHVKPTEAWSALGAEAAVPQELVIGELHAYDASSPWGGWITTDPALRLRGASKGNHVHLACAGLFETREADPRRNERKCAFLRARLLPALLASYALAPRLEPPAVRARGSSAEAPHVEGDAPGFHVLFDGREHASALALARYDAEQQPLEHAWFAAAMRARLLAARPLRDPESGELRPLWSDGWLSREADGALVQRVETPIDVAEGRYRLRLAVRYSGIDATTAPLGAVSPETRLARSATRDALGCELLGFDAALAAARRIAALGAALR